MAQNLGARHSGSEYEVARLRTYSFSDRIRYYWADESVTRALENLLGNLSTISLPETLISQAFMGLDFGEIPARPEELMEAHINRCVGRYYQASGHS